jgi:hypothetical protein
MSTIVHPLVRMRNTCGMAAAMLSLLICGGARAQGKPAAPGLEIFADHRPPGVPAHYLITPHGYFDPSCVVELADEEVLDSEDNVVAGNGFRRPLAPCAFPHFHKDGSRAGPIFDTPTVSSWVADVESTSTGASSWISANWTVPHNPISVGSQVVYFFPGFEPLSTGDTILQPVLGWNHINTGAHWSIASWNCCRNGNNIHSPLVTVSAGANLFGYVWGTGCNSATGVCAAWQVLTSVANGPQTTLNTDSYGEVLNWDFSGVLEAYNVNVCQQYPPDNGITFSNVTVRDVNGTTVQPAWSSDLLSVTPACGRTASFTNTTATINWCIPLSAGAACGTACGTTAPDGCGGTVTCPACHQCPGSVCSNGTCCPANGRCSDGRACAL